MRLIDADEVLKKMDLLTEKRDTMIDFYSGLDTGRDLIENAILKDDENPSEFNQAIAVLEDMLDDYGPYLEDYPEIVQAVRLAQKVLKERGGNHEDNRIQVQG